MRHMRQAPRLSSKTVLCPAPVEEPIEGAYNVSCRGLVANAMTDNLYHYNERMQALGLP